MCTVLAAGAAAFREPVEASPALWTGFTIAILLLILLDLLVLHRKAHAISMREALLGSALWIGLALAFNGWLLIEYGALPAADFFTAWLVEKSLSVDNLFVFLLIFTAFGVKPEHQHHVLFYGIIGAIVLRAAFIIGGVALLERFEWLTLVFAGMLAYAGIRTLMPEREPGDPSRHPLVRVARKLLPMTRDLRDGSFFVREGGKLLATPLVVVLIMLEFTDLIFAVDSIPAVLAITRDPFLAFTSNVLALLGLRALYFALAGLLAYVHYLRYGLGVVLLFVASKLLVAGVWQIHIDPLLSLGVIVSVLVGAVLVSWLRPVREEEPKTVVVERAAVTGIYLLPPEGIAHLAPAGPSPDPHADPPANASPDRPTTAESGSRPAEPSDRPPTGD